MEPVTVALIASALASSGAVAATVSAVRNFQKRDKPVRHLTLTLDGKRVEVAIDDSAQVEHIVEDLMQALSQDETKKRDASD